MDSYRAAYNDFRTQFFTVEELQRDMNIGHLCTLEPLFYNTNSWNKEKMSRFVESLIVGQPQPALFFDGSQSIWYILNGYKRLNTLFHFCKNEFALQYLYFYCDQFENKKFSELPLLIQRKILNYRFPVHILNPGSSDSVRYGIYTTLLDNSQKQQKNYIRSFIYPISFSYLKEACIPSHIYFQNSTNYTLEDIAGHLLVYLLYKKGLFPSIKSLSDSSMDLLTNFLLKHNTNFPIYINQTQLGQKLEHALSLLRGVYPDDIQMMDATLAILSVSNTPSIAPNNLKYYWDQMLHNSNYQGDTFEKHLNRIYYLKSKLQLI